MEDLAEWLDRPNDVQRGATVQSLVAQLRTLGTFRESMLANVKRLYRNRSKDKMARRFVDVGVYSEDELLRRYLSYLVSQSKERGKRKPALSSAALHEERPTRRDS